MKKYIAGIAAWGLIIAAFVLASATVHPKEDCSGKPDKHCCHGSEKGSCE